MDAVKFIEESKRMCRSHDGCYECSARADDDSCKLHTLYGVSATEKIELIEAWSAAHPRKTRQSVFLEQWPETVLDAFGVVQLCPMYISATHRDSDGECKDLEGLCIDCRREFWMQEVE